MVDHYKNFDELNEKEYQRLMTLVYCGLAETSIEYKKEDKALINMGFAEKYIDDDGNNLIALTYESIEALEEILGTQIL
jgi:hypothetical protein